MVDTASKLIPAFKNSLLDILTRLSPDIPAKVSDLADDVFGGHTWAELQSVTSSISALEQKGWKFNRCSENGNITLHEPHWALLRDYCAQPTVFAALERNKTCHTPQWIRGKIKKH